MTKNKMSGKALSSLFGISSISRVLWKVFTKASKYDANMINENFMKCSIKIFTKALLSFIFNNLDISM